MIGSGKSCLLPSLLRLTVLPCFQPQLNWNRMTLGRVEVAKACKFVRFCCLYGWFWHIKIDWNCMKTQRQCGPETSLPMSSPRRSCCKPEHSYTFLILHDPSWSYPIHPILSTGIPVDQCPLESGPCPQSWHIQCSDCSGKNVHISKHRCHAPLATAKTISRGMRPNLTALPKTEKHTLWIYTASSKGLLKSLKPRERIEKHWNTYWLVNLCGTFSGPLPKPKVPHWK